MRHVFDVRRLGDPYFWYLYRGRLKWPYYRLRFAAFGSGSILDRPGFVYRPRLMSVGERVWISRGAWLEVPVQVPMGEPVLRIGNGVVIRQHVTVSAAESVVIEDDASIGAWTSIYDADHTLGPRGSTIWYPVVTTPIRIGRGTWIGERVAVLRGTDIGCHCVIGANSVVKGPIPDYSIAVGVPARVIGSTREMIDRWPLSDAAAHEQIARSGARAES